MTSAYVCRNCGLAVGYWGRKDGGYWKHHGGWRSTRSCGQPAEPVEREAYERAMAAVVRQTLARRKESA